MVRSFSRSVASMALLLAFGTLIPGQLSFEFFAPGEVISTAPNLEGWIADSGVTQVMPMGPIVPGMSGFPTEGTQWALLSTSGTTGGLAVPAGGPLVRVPGAVDFARLRRTVVPMPDISGTASISFTWTYVTPECSGPLSSGNFNDGLSVDLLDPATELVLFHILYRDTFSPELVPGAVTPHSIGVVPTGPCGPALEESPPGSPHLTTVVIPPALYGQPLILEFAAWDGGDASGRGYLWLDEVRVSGVPGPVAPLSLAIVPQGGQMFLLQATALQAPAPGYYDLVILASLDTSLPVGVGPLLGLMPDPLLLDILGLPQGVEPFRPTMQAPFYEFGPFFAPAGLTMDLVAVGFTPPLAQVQEIAPVLRTGF